MKQTSLLRSRTPLTSARTGIARTTGTSATSATKKSAATTKTSAVSTAKAAAKKAAKKSAAKKSAATKAVAKKTAAKKTRAKGTGRTGRIIGMILHHRRAVIVIGAGAIAAAAIPVTRAALKKLDERRRYRMVADGTIDELTGLPNRAEAERMLGEMLEKGKTKGRRVALIYLDLDDFAQCNATFGAAAGDHVLQVTAARIQAQLRSGDTVCRLGGDDFVVLMEPAGPDHLLSRIGERIVDSIAQPISYDGEAMMVSASCGVAVAINGEGEAGAMITQGSRAIDRARASGRHVVQF
jgi:diguanylate cyclase (GGDEF)-like protein